MGYYGAVSFILLVQLVCMYMFSSIRGYIKHLVTHLMLCRLPPSLSPPNKSPGRSYWEQNSPQLVIALARSLSRALSLYDHNSALLAPPPPFPPHSSLTTPNKHHSYKVFIKLSARSWQCKRSQQKQHKVDELLHFLKGGLCHSLNHFLLFATRHQFTTSPPQSTAL